MKRVQKSLVLMISAAVTNISMLMAVNGLLSVAISAITGMDVSFN